MRNSSTSKKDMRNDCSKWKDEIDDAIVEVCVKIIKEPCSYFSEADIQYLLVEKLRGIEHIKKDHPTNIKRGKDSTGKYETSLLHREYGAGESKRIDVVVFDPADVRKINNVHLKDGTQYLKPAYAFELGTEKTKDIFDHIQRDLKKLKSSKGTGYLIHIYKDSTKSRTGTETRDRTEENIDRRFKQAFLRNPQGNSNVKILAILLRAYRNQKNFRGKCEIFDGKKWVKKNVSKNKELREAVRKQLV